MRKTVFITGVNRGLGKELFQLFVSRKYFVYGVVRNESDQKELQRRYPENSRVILADLSTDESIELIQASVQGNPVDLLINNAGIAGNAHLINNVKSVEIMDLFNVHCLGVFRTTKALSNNLIKAAKPIVLNLNSRLGSITRQSNGQYKNLTISYSYRIAKAAQNMLTNCIRAEFKDRIEVLSIHPGRMKTEISSTDADIEPKEVANRILDHYERGELKEANGIIELEKEVIEW